ncbi:MAG: glycosyltransferase [Verrucomicrobia bacterium]|nr:glycosyltransferase [Verrucomicrobiota bacterium]
MEYYSTLSPALLQFEADFDTIGALEMPKLSYYHKHLMYNIGFLLSKGEIIVICDSDAMAKPTFIESIIKEFENNPNIILHLDQFRNSRKDLYPFNYPSFEDVIGEGCINWTNGITTGIAAKTDILHRRNYGACFCCKRDDYIAIGGADEHIDYVGHICGPYELTFRLSNLGKLEIWHHREFLYHTWHPGSDGVDNYLGPHDGRNVSSTALEHVATGRILPHVTNPLIKKLQNGESVSSIAICKNGIAKDNFEITNCDFLKNKIQVQNKAKETYQEAIKDPQLLYDQVGELNISEISTHLESKDLSGQKKLIAKRTNSFSLLTTNILLFIHCVKTSSKVSSVKTTSQHNRTYLPPLVNICFKAFISLLQDPKSFAGKLNHLTSRYKYLKNLQKKFLNYYKSFKEGLDNSKKAIIFTGNDLQKEFLQGLIATIELDKKSYSAIALSSLIQVETLASFKEKSKTSDNFKYYFTKSAFTQLRQSKKLSEEPTQAI